MFFVHTMEVHTVVTQQPTFDFILSLVLLRSPLNMKDGAE